MCLFYVSIIFPIDSFHSNIAFISLVADRSCHGGRGARRQASRGQEARTRRAGRVEQGFRGHTTELPHAARRHRRPPSWKARLTRLHGSPLPERREVGHGAPADPSLQSHAALPHERVPHTLREPKAQSRRQVAAKVLLVPQVRIPPQGLWAVQPRSGHVVRLRTDHGAATRRTLLQEASRSQWRGWGFRERRRHVLGY